MGLYFCVFGSSDTDTELDGVDVGSCSDFASFRATVAERLERGQWGSRFPVLMLHSWSDGEWSPAEADELRRELEAIQQELDLLPPKEFPEGSWQSVVAESTGLAPRSLAECFIDIDGDLLTARLRDLAELASNRGRPISLA